ncbi:MAG: hypothetical protein R3318_04915, partial [Gammaproteobacteria bacterium]|nr:hypothetical protein [Gammaproteobacteria bacterium]
WLETTPVDNENISIKMQALRKLGAPYTNEQIGNARQALEGKTEMDAMIAYLQGLGTSVKTRR